MVLGDELVDGDGGELGEAVAEDDACDADHESEEGHFGFVLISVYCWGGN